MTLARPHPLYHWSIAELQPGVAVELWLNGTGAAMDVLKLVEDELAAFRKSGRAIHLAHAARALREARDELKQARTAGNVGRHQNGGQ